MNDDQNKPPATAGSPATITEIPTENAEARRRFIRASAVSGAVLLTLHNRAAWGQAKDVVCVSESVWESYTTEAASAFERHRDKEEIQKFQDALTSTEYEDHVVPGEVSGEICLKPVSKRDSSTPPDYDKGKNKHDGGNDKGKGKSGWNRNGRP